MIKSNKFNVGDIVSHNTFKYGTVIATFHCDCSYCHDAYYDVTLPDGSTRLEICESELTRPLSQLLVLYTNENKSNET